MFFFFQFQHLIQALKPQSKIFLAIQIFQELNLYLKNNLEK